MPNFMPIIRKDSSVPGLKKDEFICDCSDIDDVLVIRKDGVYLITKVMIRSLSGMISCMQGSFLRMMNVLSIILCTRMVKMAI